MASETEQGGRPAELAGMTRPEEAVTGGFPRLPTSAGLLIYRWQDHGLQVLLIHPGGPFWQGKDDGAWQIPKGGARPGEDMLQAALREFEEEVGARPSGRPWLLTRIRQAGGKRVEVFALESDFDPAALVSNRFEIEWPPGSGQVASFPEADRAAWFLIGAAGAKILASQAPLLKALERAMAAQQSTAR